MDAKVLAEIRQAYDTRGIADGLRAMLPLMDPDVEVVPSGAFPGTQGIFRGHDGVRAFFAQLDEAFDEFWYDLERLVPYADDVVVAEFVTHGRGRGSGLRVQLPAAHVIQVRNGLIVRAETHMDRGAAHASARELSSG